MASKTMLMVSSRKEFWSATEFADEDAIRDVVLDDPNPAVDTEVSEAEYLARLEGKKILLLVHGYNNTEDDVTLGYARVLAATQKYVPGQYDLVTGYTWPGGELGISYPIARSRANSAAPRLARWLKKVAAAAGAVDVMSHSLGARVALKGLDTGPASTKIRNLYLFAAAVDNESIEKGEDFHDACRRCERVLVVHARTDKTLAIWYRIGDAILPWQWADLLDSALGYSGPEDTADIIKHSPHVTVANGKNQGLDHGDYKDHPAVYGFLKKFLAGKTPEQFYTL